MRRMMINVLLSVVIASVVACSRPTTWNEGENDAVVKTEHIHPPKTAIPVHLFGHFHAMAAQKY